jgi:CRP-like cAMP-binding protein
VTSEPRNATAVADERTEVYTVGRDVFRKYEAISKPFIDLIRDVYATK